MSKIGWVSIHRQIQDCWIWSKKPFSYGQAWVDLLLLANHRETKLSFDGKLNTIQAGAFITSVLKLSQKWGWSRHKVSDFLNLLESDNMIEQKRDNKKTFINIVNYDIYQIVDSEKGQQKDNKRTTKGQQKDTDNNDNNVNNNSEYKYSQVVNSVVDLFHEICKSYPRVRAISANREKAINARLKKYSLDDLRTVFEKAEASDFLKGQNNRNWSANFDWLLNDTNIAKVLDGNYDNKERGKSNERVGSNVKPLEGELERLYLERLYGE